MATTLELITFACRSDATRMLNGNDHTLSSLYRTSSVSWLIAEQEKNNSGTTLRLLDLDGLAGDKTIGPLNGSICNNDQRKFLSAMFVGLINTACLHQADRQGHICGRFIGSCR